MRVIDASPDAGEVDVFAKGNEKALFAKLNFQSVKGYNDVDPMDVTLELRREGQQNAILTIPNVKFETGKIYTIVIAGRAQGTPKLDAIKIEDRLVGESAPPTR